MQEKFRPFAFSAQLLSGRGYHVIFCIFLLQPETDTIRHSDNAIDREILLLKISLSHDWTQ